MSNEATWRAEAEALSDDEIMDRLPHCQPRKRAAYADVLARRSGAKADDLRDREVDAAETQADMAKRAYDLSKWSLAVAVFALLVSAIAVVVS